MAIDIKCSDRVKAESHVRINQQLNNIRSMTFEQLDAYIDNNVNDLASAKQFLKIISKVTLYNLKCLE